MHAGSLELGMFSNIIKVYRCQINRQAFHETIKIKSVWWFWLTALTYSKSFIFLVWNNDFILFYSVNHYSQDMFSWKLLNETKKKDLCIQNPVHFFFTLCVLWCLSPDALNRSWQTLGKDQATCQPDTAETVTWEGRHTVIWWFSQKQRQRNRGQKGRALTFSSTPQLQWVQASMSWMVLANIA